MDDLPLIEVEGFLLVSVQTDLHDELAQRLNQRICEHIARSGSRGVIIDISTVEILDTYMGRMLEIIAAASRLLGAQTMLVGMRPEVAMTLVELGMQLQGIHTALNLDRGLARMRELTAGS